ncbi:MAG TPA: DUF3237 domain-containing protein, partial [Acidimicrobiales bacterium]|nr:DUF3237 domain-containing protein [Acidimicrobiales bacterium]
VEFTFECELADPLFIPGGPYGTRVVAPASGGTVRGERLRGELVGGGGDWILIGADGWARIDVRIHIATDDGALLYMSYGGVLEMNDAVMAAVLERGRETGFGEQYFWSTPRIETGDERYAWATQTVFLARGRITGNGVAYEVYRAP